MNTSSEIHQEYFIFTAFCYIFQEYYYGVSLFKQKIQVNAK